MYCSCRLVNSIKDTCPVVMATSRKTHGLFDRDDVASVARLQATAAHVCHERFDVASKRFGVP